MLQVYNVVTLNFLIILFVYFWLCWIFIAGLFSSCGEQGLLLGMMLGLLTAVASLVGIPRL